MDWKFEKNMYPILDTRVECKDLFWFEFNFDANEFEYNQIGM